MATEIVPIASPVPAPPGLWARFRTALYRLWVLKVKVPLALRTGRLLCWYGRHEWEHAPAINERGEIMAWKVSRNLRCKRPHCRALRGDMHLVREGHWLETDDFMVLARLDCKKCFGRGYTGKMVLPGNVRAKVPCHCLRVQPAYIEHIAKSAGDKAAMPISAPTGNAAAAQRVSGARFGGGFGKGVADG